MRAAALVLVCGALAAVPGLVGAHPLPRAPRCPIFPANNPWNQRVDRLPAAKNSAELIASIGASSAVHPDFGAGLYAGQPIGIPYVVVSSRTRRVHVGFDYSSESDHAGYPLPRNVPIEGGTDRHVIVVDRDSCLDYELFAAHPIAAGGSWHAGSGAIFNLRSNALRPAGWTSADAAGLPILPGLARYEEVKRGLIDHALRFTAKCTSQRYVYPARHDAPPPECGSGLYPPMGLRVRLKASTDISGLPRQAQIVARALKQYGLILADNGAPWYISGTPDPRWSNDALHLLGRLRGRDFQVVNTASLPHPGR